MALDRDMKGTCSMKFLFKQLSQPCTGEKLSKVCRHTVHAETNCFEHAYENHSSLNFIGDLSSEGVASLKENSSNSISFIN